MPEQEPRFGLKLGDILSKLYDHQHSIGIKIGRLEANSETTKESISRIETSLANVANRLEKKIDLLNDSIRGNNRDLSRALENKERMCKDHDSRIGTLEHDKSYMRGFNTPVKVLFGLFGTGLLGLLGFISTMLFDYFTK